MEFKEPKDIQVVALLGGRGTRLGAMTDALPKPMIPIHGRPFFEYQFQLLLSNGFRKFLFLVGYLGERIEEYFGDGSRWGEDVRIEYCRDGERRLGTAGAVAHACGRLEDHFLLTYGDGFLDVDYFEIVYRYFRGLEQGKKALMTVFKNDGRFDRSNVRMDGGQIAEYGKENSGAGMDYIDYGIEMFKKETFLNLPRDQALDLSVLQAALVERREMAVCIVRNRFYEIGTERSLDEFSDYVGLRFFRSTPAVFLDRDGVINEIVFNEDTEQLDSPLRISQFRFKKDAIAALCQLKTAGFLVLVVTNQPAAAKGKTRLSELFNINGHMLDRLRDAGVDLDGVAMCPHHPEGSARSKERFLIRKCHCRKPDSGMLENIMARRNIDRGASCMIGDSFTDILAGRKAGLRTALVGECKCDMCERLGHERPDIQGKDIIHTVRKVLNGFQAV